MPPPSDVQVASAANSDEQRRLVLGAQGVEEVLEQAAARRLADLEARPVLVHALARAVHDLPAGRLVLAEDAGDVGIVAVEHFVQQERRALLGRQALEHDEEGDRQVGCELALGIGRRRRRSPAIGSGSHGPT